MLGSYPNTCSYVCAWAGSPASHQLGSPQGLAGQAGHFPLYGGHRSNLGFLSFAQRGPFQRALCVLPFGGKTSGECPGSDCSCLCPHLPTSHPHPTPILGPDSLPFPIDSTEDSISLSVTNLVMLSVPRTPFHREDYNNLWHLQKHLERRPVGISLVFLVPGKPRRRLYRTRGIFPAALTLLSAAA